MAGDATGNEPASQRTTSLVWVADIEEATLGNTNFRAVLFTGEHTQLTVMRLRAGEEIGWEQHAHLDQFLRIEQGTGRLDVGRSRDGVDEQHEVQDDWAFIIPAGTWHNVVNTGDGDLHLFPVLAAGAPPGDGPPHQGRRRRARARLTSRAHVCARPGSVMMGAMTSIDDPGAPERITGLQDDDIQTEREPRAATMDVPSTVFPTPGGATRTPISCSSRARAARSWTDVSCPRKAKPTGSPEVR